METSFNPKLESLSAVAQELETYIETKSISWSSPQFYVKNNTGLKNCWQNFHGMEVMCCFIDCDVSS